MEKFTPANWITLALFAVGVIGGAYKLDQSVARNAEEIAVLKGRVDNVGTEIKTIAEERYEDQIDLARTLTSIQSDVRYMKDALMRLEKHRPD